MEMKKTEASSLSVNIRYLNLAREKAGTSEETVTLAAGNTVADLLALL